MIKQFESKKDGQLGIVMLYSSYRVCHCTRCNNYRFQKTILSGDRVKSYHMCVNNQFFIIKNQ